MARYGECRVMASNINTFRTQNRYNPNTGQIEKQVVQIDYYVYRAGVENLGPGMSASDQVLIQADADFTVEKFNFYASTNNNFQTDSGRLIPAVDISIQDTGSGRLLTDEPIEISSLAGYGALPAILETPRRFSASSAINVTFTNFSAADTYTRVSLLLVGYKAWPLNKPK